MEAKLNILTRSAVLTKAVAGHLNDSIVYMDSGAGEAAFAAYGLRLLQGWTASARCPMHTPCVIDFTACIGLHSS